MAQNWAWRLSWSDRFEVGVAALDVDHRELVRLIDVACCAAQAGERAELLADLEQLSRFAAEHFEREETVLQTVPGLSGHFGQHAERHRQCIEQLTRLRHKLQLRDDLGDVRQLCGELIDWFVKHAVGDDSKIRGYFHEGR